MYKAILQVKSANNTLRKHFIHTTEENLKSFSKWYRSLWMPQSAEPPYSHVTQIGDPVLRQRAQEVPKEHLSSKEVNFIIDMMIKALRKYNCVGLAAPQIGVSLKIILMEFPERLKKEFPKFKYEAQQMETLPLTIFVNPTLKVINYNKKAFTESCASIKGYSAVVERYEEVLVEGYSRNGEAVSLNLKGWNARIAQHEMDHLNGALYTDVMDSTTLSCTCWEAVNSKAGRIEIPFYK